MVKRILTLFCWLSLFGLNSVSAQELNCKVQVIAQRLQNADPQIFKTLENAIFEFMNNRKWTSDVYQNNEKIECTILINVSEELGNDYYRASVSIQSSRPAYNSTYNSIMLNHIDNDWVFQYAQFQPLEFNENAFIGNHTSMLAFYAYTIIGLDYDSFSKKGGEKYFQKAMSIRNTVPANLGEKAPGWQPTDGSRNRYWLIQDLMSARYADIREAIYQYHIEGIDKMYENPTKARTAIYNSLESIQTIISDNPNSMLITTFFNTKSDELINIYKGAPSNEKAKALQLLYKIDPSNSQKYKKIIE